MINNDDLNELLPDYYSNVTEMAVLMELQNNQTGILSENVKRALDNQFIKTMHMEVLEAYESFYNISKSEDDPIEQRRFRVLARMVSRPPYTPGYLQEQLEMLGTTAKITEYPQQYRVDIETNLKGPGEVDELDYIFKTIIPSNLVVNSNNIMRTNAETEIFAVQTAAYALYYTATSDFDAEYTSDAIMNSGVVASEWTTIVTN